MNELIDKSMIMGVIFLFSMHLETGINSALVAAILFSLTCSAMCSFFSKDKIISGAIVLVYIIASAFFNILLLFMPLVVYDIYSNKRIYPLVAIIPLLYAYNISQGSSHLLPSFALCLLALLLSFRTRKYTDSKIQYYEFQDMTREASLELANKNRHLLEKHDYQVNMATLRERNRIAREIHDNVGHLITRSIMQTKALEVICQNKENPKNDIVSGLQAVNQTLVGAMESIRQSVHHIHDDSIDIKMEMESLINAFSFCPVNLTIDGNDLPLNVRYCFIAIAKEALSNTAKHSNATSMTISIIKHPGFYQLICKDNGETPFNGNTNFNSNEKGSGMGLQNIKDRAESLGGVVSITNTNGFRIFISIPVDNYKANVGG